MATTLFHGPLAREAAVQAAESHGRMLVEPLGDDGLKVDVSRQIVERLSAVPLGDAVGTLVIGPVDAATDRAADALLKMLEEFNSKYLMPFLWAEDLGGVQPTIRSRCIQQWCPGRGGATAEGPYLRTAEMLCQAALRRRRAAVIEHLKDNKGIEGNLARAAPEVLARKTDWPLEARLRLWARLRPALMERPGQTGTRRGTPTALQTLVAFLV